MFNNYFYYTAKERNVKKLPPNTPNHFLRTIELCSPPKGVGLQLHLRHAIASRRLAVKNPGGCDQAPGFSAKGFGKKRGRKEDLRSNGNAESIVCGIQRIVWFNCADCKT